MGALKYVRVFIAEAEHLLHAAHGPKEVVLGFAEDVLHALATGTLPDVSQPPRVDAPAVVAPPVADPRIDVLVEAVKAQQAQFQQLLTMMGAPPPAPAAPVAVPAVVVPEQLPADVPATTTAPMVFPVPVPKT